jgi:hypothetical protein
MAVVDACRCLGLSEPVQGTATFFSADLDVKLPGWVYPVVIDAACGKQHYYCYNEARGKLSRTPASAA